ncbi:MAG: hypothetical protein IJH39_10465 [Clostridia bacterium]|nr:hypothetical protein [Clostridia bacterium]
MINFVSDIIFLLVTSFICLKAIGYGIYEIKEKSNKFGGTFIALFSLFSTIFANIMIKLY